MISTSKEILEKFIRELHRLTICVKIMTLNLMLLINDELKGAANVVFNPRNAMHVSRNDGLMETFTNHKKDTMILTNALISMTSDRYSAEQRAQQQACLNWKG